MANIDAATPMSDFDIDGSATPRIVGIRDSSARPGGPLSESLAPQADDEGFADDQIPLGTNRPRNGRDRPITRVEDNVGLVLQETFERFIET
jgi:DNA replication licensing factor MCM6